MNAHAFSRTCVAGARPGSVASARASSPQFPMQPRPAAASAAARRRSMAVDLSSSSSAAAAAPRRSRPLVPNSSLAGDAGTLSGSGGGGGGGSGGGKGLGGDGKGEGDSGEGEGENAPISAAAIAATVCLFFEWRAKLGAVPGFSDFFRAHQRVERTDNSRKGMRDEQNGGETSLKTTKP